MSPPTFLGIGTPKSGTTWLHNVLTSHADVFVPHGVKEIRYFDRYFERGPAWYAAYFAQVRPMCRAVGEITPSYLYGKDTPVRVRQFGSIEKLIAVFRDPVERALSYYHHVQRINGYEHDLDRFIEDHPECYLHGRYTHHVLRWLDYFPPQAFLFLAFEAMTVDPVHLRFRLASFLDVPVDRFRQPPRVDAANVGFTPRWPRTYRQLHRLRRWARDTDNESLILAARTLGLRKLAQAQVDRRATGSVVQGVSRLRSLLEGETEKLSAATGVNFAQWWKLSSDECSD